MILSALGLKSDLNLFCLRGWVAVASDYVLGELDLSSSDLRRRVHDVPHAQNRTLQKLMAKAVGQAVE